MSSDEHSEAHFAYAVVYDDLRLCGCGTRDAILSEIVNVLRSCPLYEQRWKPTADWGSLGAEFLLHVMNDADLLEHGGSVYGSWITAKGSRFLAAMDGKPDDWLDGVGYSCSACPESSLSAASMEDTQ